MKRLFFLLLLTFTFNAAVNAQDDKDKVKKTSTIPQKVHNTFSKKKHYKGYKSKHKHGGHVQKHKVDLKEGEERTKSK